MELKFLTSYLGHVVVNYRSVEQFNRLGQQDRVRDRAKIVNIEFHNRMS
jgi:hypothetical protein